jgi:hypothetical protein
MTKDEIREAAENDLLTFIRLVSPHLLLSQCHIDLVNWWQSADRKKDCLVLMPRGHLKSKLIALKKAWEITRDPTVTILYVSATAGLAEKQLYSIQKILTSPKYRSYWPDMVNEAENDRELWTKTEIAVDHPKRAAEGIRDPTVKAAGLTTNITGFHATSVALDDVVVPNNAYTEDGRRKVAAAISQISSIKEPEAVTDCVGTRYHPKDLYDTFMKQTYTIFDEETGDPIGDENIWDVYLRVVETDGVFLWPRERRDDGKFFGFNATVLSKIKGEYEDVAQFFSQYYNNPNDPSTARISRSNFQYYDRRHLQAEDGRWYVNGRPLNVFAGIDFAYSLSKKADSTCLVVIGVDSEHTIYVLDIHRFKSNRIKDYFDAIYATYNKWGYKKIRAEVTAAQEVIVRDLKENYIAARGMALVVDEFRPTRHIGSKEERVNATLEPKYDNMQVYHYKGGECAMLEDELVMAKPPHDDIKDALTAAVDIAVPPRASRALSGGRQTKIKHHSRFGGVI